MAVKTANLGHYTYPAGPAAGLAVTGGAANTLTTTYVAFVTTTSAVYITGMAVEALTSTATPTYAYVQLAVGATGAEVVVDSEVFGISIPGNPVTGTRIGSYVPIFPPVPVATSSRMAAKTADSVGSLPWLVTLRVIAQANVVDAGVEEAVNVTQIAGTTSKGAAGYVGIDWAQINAPTTVQGLTGTTISAAQTVATVTGNVTGSVGSVTGAVGSVTGAVGSVTGNVGGNVTGSVGSVAVVVSANVTQFAGTTSKGAAGYAGIDWAQINAPTTVQGLTGTTISATQTVATVTGNVNGSVGSVTGAVGSVTGAVGSVTGNVGGNVVGSVASVVAIVSANVTRFAGTTSVGAAGYVGLDWSAINAPTTVQGLTGTTISATQAVATVTGNVVGSVGSVTGAVGSVTGAVGSVTGNVGGNVVGSVGSVVANVVVSTNSDKTGYSLIQTFPSNFSSLSIDASGNAAITSNVKKDTAFSNFMFLMTDSTNHAPLTGLTVTATRSLDGGAFAACANAVTEISGGWYKINLAATDTNANRVALLFSATGADNTNIEINTQP